MKILAAPSVGVKPRDRWAQYRGANMTANAHESRDPVTVFFKFIDSPLCEQVLGRRGNGFDFCFYFLLSVVERFQ